MRYKWLNKKVDNHKIILFFNGWGMDECVVNHLDSEDFDVLMFYNYNTLDTDFNFESLNTYQEINLVAWSMGVMIATFFSEIKFHKKIAINGTLKPIDIKYGIHPRVYDLTIRGFDIKGREKFIDSMFDAGIALNFTPVERELVEQKTELIAIKELSSSSLINNFSTSFYNKVLISDNDKIIPTKSQIEYWGMEANTKGGHCPFFQIKKWSDLL